MATKGEQSQRADLAAIDSHIEVVLASDIKWKPLNPARGNKGPQAGTLWGDQTKAGSSGFLVKFVDGFSSPPHIHNITYRGVVIAGRLFNDDPDARPMWMPTGSYWMQPAGEVHITAARGSGVAFLEIQEGPYLVMPPSDAFDRGQRPVSIVPSNMVWLGSEETSWVDASAESDLDPQLTFLWGQPDTGGSNATLVRLPGGFTGTFTTHSNTFRAVVIDGLLKHRSQAASNDVVLPPGSYFGSEVPASHCVTAEKASLIYVRTVGRYSVAADARGL